ncbi:MAG: glycosyltransferase family 2 protein [archaeon]|nr:glycosyltransferase family 2 protein [archaeon]
MDYPFVSIAILNYNGRTILGKDFDRYLKSVLQTDYPDFELLFVDNGSEDDSVHHVTSIYNDSRLRVIKIGRNLGFAQGNNVGIANANQKAEYIVLLNNDIEVQTSWLKEIIEKLDQDQSIAMAQPKILRDSDRSIIDSTGGFIDKMGRAYDRGSGKKEFGQYDVKDEVFYAKGAAIIMRRSILNEIGLLDPDYFIYYEETDLCWRAHLKGYRVVLIPSSMVYHRSSATMGEQINERILFMRRRNQIATLIKNYELGNLVKYLSLFLGKSILYSIRLVFSRRIRLAYSIWRAIWWNIKNIKKTLRKRAKVQLLIRRVSDKSILSKMLTIREYDSIG